VCFITDFSILPLSSILIFEFEIVPKVWYSLFVLLINRKSYLSQFTLGCLVRFVLLFLLVLYVLLVYILFHVSNVTSVTVLYILDCLSGFLVLFRRKNVYCSYSTLSTTIIITVLTEWCCLQNKVIQDVCRVIIKSANIIH
jgi:hypothetical protein